MIHHEEMRLNINSSPNLNPSLLVSNTEIDNFVNDVADQIAGFPIVGGDPWEGTSSSYDLFPKCPIKTNAPHGWGTHPHLKMKPPSELPPHLNMNS